MFLPLLPTCWTATGRASKVGMAKRGELAEREMRLAGLEAERAYLFGELCARRIGSDAARTLIWELDLFEARHSFQGP